MTFTAPTIPYDSVDNGLRITKRGKITVGSHRADYVSQCNPEHIAHTIAVREHRKMIRSANLKMGA